MINDCKLYIAKNQVMSETAGDIQTIFI